MTRIGFIGAGAHAESHLPHIAAIPDCDITMIADLDMAKAENAKLRFAPGANTTDDWREVVTSETVDAVIITTPDRYHTRQLIGAIANNKHSLTDKPLADTWEDYNKLRGWLGTAADAGLVTTSCHPRRFDPPFINTHALINNPGSLRGVFGLPFDTAAKPVHFALQLNYSPPSRQGLHTSFMFDHLPHEIDTMSHFFGQSGLAHIVSHKNDAYVFSVSGVREDGINFKFDGNRQQKERGWKESWQVAFDNDAVFSVDAHTGTIAYKRKPDEKPYVRRLLKDNKPLFSTDYDERFGRTNQHFVRAVQRKETPYLTTHDLLLNTVAALAVQTVGLVASVGASSLTVPRRFS